MRIRHGHRIGLACCIVVELAVGMAHAERYAPQVGRPHADFVLPSVADRAPVALSDFRGKKVLLVHFASW